MSGTRFPRPRPLATGYPHAPGLIAETHRERGASNADGVGDTRHGTSRCGAAPVWHTRICCVDTSGRPPARERFRSMLLIRPAAVICDAGSCADLGYLAWALVGS